jgi:preprotein translocase subunit SecE
MATHGPARGFKIAKNNDTQAMFNYFKEVRAEMRHVSWPTRQQAVVYTIVVIVVSLVVAFYLGILDYIFDTIIQKII